jgi:transcription initiation factor TFIIE subunit alpha
MLESLGSADRTSYSRQEQREGAMKSINREYYFIDYRHAIDAAKFKLHKIDMRIKKDSKPNAAKAELRCAQCGSQWNSIDVIDLVDPQGRDSGLLCKQCDFPLTEINADEGAAIDNDDTPAKFNRLFKPLLDLMQQIDDVKIPAIDGKDALENAVELPRDKDINPGARHEVVPLTTARPTAVKGTNNVVEKIEVQIATNSEYNEAARAAEKARADKVAAQNQLPDWHVKSTVTKPGHDGSTAAARTTLNGVETPTIKMEALEPQNGKEQNLDDIFTALQAEQKRKDDEEDEDEEDDDEDEFEDVVVNPSNGVPDTKRVKLDSSAAPTPTNATTPAVSTGDGGDESDEDEFVDV